MKGDNLFPGQGEGDLFICDLSDFASEIAKAMLYKVFEVKMEQKVKQISMPNFLRKWRVGFAKWESGKYYIREFTNSGWELCLVEKCKLGVPEIAHALCLDIQNPHLNPPSFTGPNPTNDPSGANKDGFTLFHDGSAADRKLCRSYTKREVMEMAGLFSAPEYFLNNVAHPFKISESGESKVKSTESGDAEQKSIEQLSRILNAYGNIRSQSISRIEKAESECIAANKELSSLISSHKTGLRPIIRQYRAEIINAFGNLPVWGCNLTVVDEKSAWIEHIRDKTYPEVVDFVLTNGHKDSRYFLCIFNDDNLI